MSPPAPDFSKIKAVYLIGIKGSAMASLAEILIARGLQVAGSDTAEVFYTDALLEKAGARVFTGFSPANLAAAPADLIIHSTAYRADNNPEVAAAIKQKRPLLNYPQALALLFNQAFGLAVCGTHGKTTTTALLAEILRKASLDPTALVGSKVRNWDSGSLSGQGPHFVIEADEYQNKLKHYQPRAIVVTNVDYDHPDFFKDEQAYAAVFEAFFQKVPADGFLVYPAFDPVARQLAAKISAPTISYGLLPSASFTKPAKVAPAPAAPAYVLAKRTPLPDQGQIIEVILPDQTRLKITLQLSGEHNALNALAALAAAHQLKVGPEPIKQALAAFRSSERRFQSMGEHQGAPLYDDYAHHPAEIKATLAAAREKYPSKKIIVAFHPHTFSRTAALFDEFAAALAPADQVYLIDIYASARENPADFKVSSRQLADLINEKGGHAQYVPTLEELAPLVAADLNADSIFITLGAGDIWKIHQKIQNIKEDKQQ